MICLGVTDPIDEEKQEQTESTAMSTSYEIVPTEWRRDEVGNISVHIINTQQTSAQENIGKNNKIIIHITLEYLRSCLFVI